MAEACSILVHCRTMVYLKTLCRFSRNVVASQSQSSITSPEDTKSCQLGCRVLCSKIGYSESHPFTVHRSQWREHRIWVCSRMGSCWLGVLIGPRISIISVVEWHKSCWNHVAEIVRVQKDIRAMLLINRTIKRKICSNLTVTNNLIEDQLSDAKENCKLCRIIGREYGFFVVVHCFLQREKFFDFDQVEHWNLIVRSYWWESSPVVGFVGSWKKRVAFVEENF